MIENQTKNAKFNQIYDSIVSQNDLKVSKTRMGELCFLRMFHGPQLGDTLEETKFLELVELNFIDVCNARKVV